MRFSLDIVSGSDGNKVDEKVKDVEVWLSIIPELVKASRRANFEFQLGLAYPYDRCHDLLCTHKFPEDLAQSLRALRPFFNLLTED
jgi:hypothetical protein